MSICQRFQIDDNVPLLRLIVSARGPRGSPPPSLWEGCFCAARATCSPPRARLHLRQLSLTILDPSARAPSCPSTSRRPRGLSSFQRVASQRTLIALFMSTEPLISSVLRLVAFFLFSSNFDIPFLVILPDIGHIEFLKRAKEQGDYLLVGVLDDQVVNRIKGSNFPIMNLHERVLSVLACRVRVLLSLMKKFTLSLLRTFY